MYEIKIFDWLTYNKTFFIQCIYPFSAQHRYSFAFSTLSAMEANMNVRFICEYIIYCSCILSLVPNIPNQIHKKWPNFDIDSINTHYIFIVSFYCGQHIFLKKQKVSKIHQAFYCESIYSLLATLSLKYGLSITPKSCDNFPPFEFIPVLILHAQSIIRKKKLHK